MNQVYSDLEKEKYCDYFLKNISNICPECNECKLIKEKTDNHITISCSLQCNACNMSLGECPSKRYIFYCSERYLSEIYFSHSSDNGIEVSLSENFFIFDSPDVSDFEVCSNNVMINNIIMNFMNDCFKEDKIVTKEKFKKIASFINMYNVFK